MAHWSTRLVDRMVLDNIDMFQCGNHILNEYQWDNRILHAATTICLDKSYDPIYDDGDVCVDDVCVGDRIDVNADICLQLYVLLCPLCLLLYYKDRKKFFKYKKSVQRKFLA